MEIRNRFKIMWTKFPLKNYFFTILCIYANGTKRFFSQRKSFFSYFSLSIGICNKIHFRKERKRKCLYVFWLTYQEYFKSQKKWNKSFSKLMNRKYKILSKDIVSMQNIFFFAISYIIYTHSFSIKKHLLFHTKTVHYISISM